MSEEATAGAQPGQSAEAQPQGQPEGSGNPTEDYLGRIKSDGEFAVQQIRDKDRAISKSQESLKKVEAILPYVDQLGGGQRIYQLLEEYARIKSNPAMATQVDSFLTTGRAPTSSEDDSLYEEPENEAVTELKQELAALKQQVSQATHTAGRQHVTSMLEEHKQRFGSAWEKIFPRVHEKVEELSQSDQGRQLLANMNEESLNALIGQAAMPIMHEIAPLLVGQEQERVQSMSTGPSAGIATTGREAPAEQRHKTVMDAFKDMERRPQ